MKTLGNILWVILGGFATALVYYLIGILYCITIIGIPFGVQIIKIGTFCLWPFGREMADKPGQPGCLSTGFNVLWILTGWWEIAAFHLVLALLFTITIIGFPFGQMHFKIALGSVFPFGKEIRSIK